MKSVFTLLLALLMFLSNFGFALGTHFCGGKAVESKLVFQQNKLHCGMDVSKMQCDDHENEGIFIKNKCCNNHYLELDTDDNFNIEINNFKIQPLQLLTLISIFIDFNRQESSTQTLITYSDPQIPLSDQFQSLYQVYII